MQNIENCGADNDEIQKTWDHIVEEKESTKRKEGRTGEAAIGAGTKKA